jgi:H+-transporting ATPase
MRVTAQSSTESTLSRKSASDANVGLRNGLTSDEASHRLKTFGPNTTPDTAVNPLRMVMEKFWAPVPWMLEAAIVLQVVLGKYVEAGIIAGLLVFNAALGLFQESRAQATLAALKSRLALIASVRRDGAWKTVLAAELVPGDVVKLSLGGVVAADVKLTGGEVLLDQSMLTGESVPIEAGPGVQTFAGALVRRGEAVAEVTATGTRTKFGRTAELVRTAHVVSSQQKAVLRVVRNIAAFNGVVIVMLVAYAYFLKMPFAEIIPLVLTAVLASIPVALPATFTLAAALGARALAKKGVLPTRLSAVDEAGTTDVLCVDKTGTLTQNALAVTTVRPLPGFDEAHVLALAALASADGGQDPVDGAIRSATLGKAVSDAPKLITFTPFDPAKKMSEATATDSTGGAQRIVKGAFAVVIGLAQHSPTATELAKELEGHGFRVLAVAAGPPTAMKLAGLIALSDPPRSDSAALVTELHELGVRTVMVTGDAPATAAIVAHAVGLDGAVCPPGPIPDSVHAEQFAVYAGVLPEDKYKLVKAFQKGGHTVGMCGDGANDAPALRQAQIGIAVSTATDVAKSAAGMVLTEPGLAGIVAAVKEGRVTFERILTYTLNTITKKTVQALFLAVGLVMTRHAILTPLLMVLIMITGDFLGMSLTTDNVRPSPTPIAWQIGNLTMAGAIMGIGELVFCTFVLAFGTYRMGFDIDALRTLAFVVIVFGNQATLYANRERRYLWSSRPSSWLLLSSVADLLIASTLAAEGIAMTPLPARTVAGTLGAAAAFAFVLDLVKVPVFNRLRIGEKTASSLYTSGGEVPQLQGHSKATPKSSWSWRLAAGALAILTFAGGWFTWSLYGGGAIHYVTEKVERGSIVRTVSTTGTVNPVKTAAVGTHASGVIQALYCDFNTKVEAGQLCAKIDPRPYRAAVDQKMADLAEAETRLKKDKDAFTHAKAIFERNKIRAKRRAISGAILEKSRNAYEEARARATLDEATVAQRQAALYAAEINLGYTDIVSPVDGTVVSRKVEVGQTVAAGSKTQLFLIAADLTLLHVDTNVSEKDIGEVKRGDMATFTVESFPNHPFTGEATQISQLPRTIGHTMTYGVVISASNPDLLLEPGMAAAITIVVNRRDDVLRVPDQALRYSPSRPAALNGGVAPSMSPDISPQVWILSDGKPAAVSVWLGLDDGAYTEVVRGGLRSGDQLIVGEGNGASEETTAIMPRKSQSTASP